MNFFETMMLFDSHTMLGILFWGNLALAAMIFTFETTIKTMRDKEYVHGAVMTRLAYAGGYFLLLLWGVIPNFLSINTGHSILFFCFYLDACLMLSFLAKADKKMKNVLRILLFAGIIIFNVLELTFKSDTIRTITSSAITMIIFGIPTVSFLAKKSISGFKRGIGGFYLVFLMTLFPRMIIPMSDSGVSLHENTIDQSAFYLILILLMICGAISTLLFIKERSDIILENMALNDQLTQIPNRHCFLHNADLLFLKCQREKREMSLMYTDIDFFKKVNDTYGHDFGDVVLKRYALVIKESVRPYDLFCRYGGEEFLMMIENNHINMAEKLARRIMERLKSEHFDEYPDFRFTISVGIASGIPNEEDTLDTYIKGADGALYEAKNGGRNTIRFVKR